MNHRLLSCKAHVEEPIRNLALYGPLEVGPIGQWESSGETVSIVGRFKSRSQYPGLTGPMIRWVTEGMDWGFFAKGLADLNPHTTSVEAYQHLPVVQ